MNGVGDEAYSGLGGVMLVFRKGSGVFQLLSGLGLSNMGKPYLTPGQMAEIAKLIAGRL